MRSRPLNNAGLADYARRSIDRRAAAARDAFPGPRRFQWDSLLLLAPSAGLLGLLFVFPIGYAVYLGFTNLQLVGINANNYWWTGLTNVRRMAHDTVFWHSVRITVVFLIASAIVGQSVLGMVLALLMRLALPVVRLSVGAVVVGVWVLPEITAALVWYAFTQAHGTLAIIAGQPEKNFLVAAPLLIVSLANLWRNVAFSMLVYSAGLRNLPTEVYEAALLEGASAIRRLFSVTLPLLRPTIVTSLLLVTLLNLSEFTLIYAMTQGGPGVATMTLPLYVYQQAFTFFSLGYGTAIALVLVVIGALFSVIFVRASRTAV
jgi:multiple sugar transport system permease protein